jgi:succinate-semialdehyde dehydrogenase/glutarate-semialdehyde dehydrogenase
VFVAAAECRFGLAAYACTRDLGRAWRLSDQLQSGMVGINEGSIGMSIAPFGGIKQSGLGSEGGTYGLEEYMVTKYTCMGHGYAPA